MRIEAFRAIGGTGLSGWRRVAGCRLLRRCGRCPGFDGLRGLFRLFGFFARHDSGDRRIALIGRRRSGQSALLSLFFARCGFVVVFGAAAELVGGEAFGRSIVHPAQACEVRHDRPPGAPLRSVMMMRITGVPMRWSSGARRRVIVTCVSGADRECRHDSTCRTRASRTRPLAVRLAHRREDLKRDPARRASAFVNRHQPDSPARFASLRLECARPANSTRGTSPDCARHGRLRSRPVLR
jgi:hypothetical protein